MTSPASAPPTTDMLMLLKVKTKQCRGHVTYSGFTFIQNVMVVREMVYSYTVFRYYLPTYSLTHSINQSLIYLLTYLLHEAESFLRS